MLRQANRVAKNGEQVTSPSADRFRGGDNCFTRSKRPGVNGGLVDGALVVLSRDRLRLYIGERDMAYYWRQGVPVVLSIGWYTECHAFTVLQEIVTREYRSGSAFTVSGHVTSSSVAAAKKCWIRPT